MAWTTPGTAVAGEVLTAAYLNTYIRDNTQALYQSIQRLGYETRTTDLQITATSFATAQDIFDNPITFTADGASEYVAKFACYRATNSAANRAVRVALDDGGTDRGQAFLYSPAGRIDMPMTLTIRWVPTAGVTTVEFVAFRDTGDGYLLATGGVAPMWMAVYGPEIT